MGEHTSVGVTVRVFLMACLYRPCQVTLLDDAYSVREPLELQWQQGPSCSWPGGAPRC